MYCLKALTFVRSLVYIYIFFRLLRMFDMILLLTNPYNQKHAACLRRKLREMVIGKGYGLSNFCVVTFQYPRTIYSIIVSVKIVPRNEIQETTITNERQKKRMIKPYKHENRKTLVKEVNRFVCKEKKSV